MLSLRFNHLLVVLKIYDTGSLSETARQLNLTISAASRSLRKCQEEFGDELFVRGPYGKGWPIDELRGKHLVVVAGGTGVSNRANTP